MSTYHCIALQAALRAHTYAHVNVLIKLAGNHNAEETAGATKSISQSLIPFSCFPLQRPGKAREIAAYKLQAAGTAWVSPGFVFP